MSELKKRVEESSAFYNGSILNFDYQLAHFTFRSIEPFFRGSKALELGPASGYMTKCLVDKFEELVLIEGSEMLLSQIPDYHNVRKFHSLFEEYETDERFDTIIMSHVLEHISDPSLVLRKVNTWLKPDGILLLSVPNAKSIHRLVAVEMGLLEDEYCLNDRDHELGHFRVYDVDILSRDVRNAGFIVEHAGGVFLKPLSNSQIESTWTTDMIEGFYQVGKKFPQFCAEIYITCIKK